MSWVVTVIVWRFISLVVAVRPQAIPDRVGGRTQNPTRFCSAANHPTRRALRGDLRCRNQRSTNCRGGNLSTGALQKGGEGRRKLPKPRQGDCRSSDMPPGFRAMELGDCLRSRPLGAIRKSNSGSVRLCFVYFPPSRSHGKRRPIDCGI